MKHPGPPLLVDYVDGTIGDDMRAKVDAHLAGCATCRDDVRAARAGKASAGALGTPAVPAGLAHAAIAEASRVAGERHAEVVSKPEGARRRPNAPRWAGLATAAAVVIAIVLLAPKLGQPSSNSSEAAAPAVAGASSSAPMGAPAEDFHRANKVVVQQKDYTDQELAALAQQAQHALENGAGAQSVNEGPAFGFDATQPTSLSTERFGPATQCLQSAFGDPQGRLVHLVYAKFNGQPAYFGVYLVSEGPGLPSNELRIDVASADSCQILVQSSARL
jgi:hypothetical protein